MTEVAVCAFVYVYKIVHVSVAAFASVWRMCTSIYFCVCVCAMRQMGNSRCAESRALCNVQP